MKPGVKGAVLLLLAFGLGVIGGAVGFAVYHTRFGDWRSPEGAARFQHRIVSRLTKDLDLRPDQRDRVEAVLKNARQEFSRLREEIGPRFREIRSRTRDQIRALLDATQQAKFDTLSQEWERRAARWRARFSVENRDAKAQP